MNARCAYIWITLLLAALAATACNVPVFRHALERWPAEPFEAVVFHRDALSPSEQRATSALTNTAAQLGANFTLRTLNLSTPPTADDKQLWRAQSNAALPWIAVRATQADETALPFWTGTPADLPPAALMDSPMRQELARRLLGGDSIVWLLLESGDKAQDDKAAALLLGELPPLQTSLQLPPPDDDAPARIEIAPGNTPPKAMPAANAPNPRRGYQLLISTTLAFVTILVLITGIAALHSLRRH